jgi:hypothetical protein
MRVRAGLRRASRGHHPLVGTTGIRDVAAVAALHMELRRTVENRTLERWAGYCSGRDLERDTRVRPAPRRPSH